MIICEICGGDVSGQSPNYRLVVGWEQIRRTGGANKIARRHELGKWAHRDCVENPLRQSMTLFVEIPDSITERPT